MFTFPNAACLCYLLGWFCGVCVGFSGTLSKNWESRVSTLLMLCPVAELTVAAHAEFWGRSSVLQPLCLQKETTKAGLDVYTP
eukprot:6477825-Amphidinium_carterae.1